MLFALCLPRMGKQKGFTDVKQGQCHIIAAKYMTTLPMNVHENVPEYDEVGAAVKI